MMKTILKKVINFFRWMLRCKHVPDTDNSTPALVKYTLVDAYESVVTAFCINEGPYKDVVFSIVKITPKELPEQQQLKMTYVYEILQSPVPAETIENETEFTTTIEAIITDLLSKSETSYETSIANNPWLTNIE